MRDELFIERIQRSTPHLLYLSKLKSIDDSILAPWNCEHLAQAHRRRKIRLFNTSAGLFVPDIITPMELVEGDEDHV